VTTLGQIAVRISTKNTGPQFAEHSRALSRQPL